MAEIISDVEGLKEYLNGVLERADHHADNVNRVVLTLIGAVIAKATGEIKVRTYNGRKANSIWFYIHENLFVLKYEHADGGRIVLAERTEQGRELASFTNADSAAAVWEVFNELDSVLPLDAANAFVDIPASEALRLAEQLRHQDKPESN